MATSSTENELIELEQKYWKALQANDVKTACELTDFPCVVSGPQGVASVGRETFEKMMGAPSYSIDRYDMSDVHARMLSDDVAVVAYKVKEDLTVDGKSLSLDAADASTWIRRNGRWLCAQHSECIAGDPFGRDRQRFL